MACEDVTLKSTFQTGADMNILSGTKFYHVRQYGRYRFPISYTEDDTTNTKFRSNTSSRNIFNHTHFIPYILQFVNILIFLQSERWFFQLEDRMDSLSSSSSSLSSSSSTTMSTDETKTAKSVSSDTVYENSTSDTLSDIKENGPFDKSDFDYDFTNPETVHDRILVVGGKDLFVLEAVLMESSDFFKVLFGENFKESGQEKIELKDVQMEDFVEFLKHLYSNNEKITEDNFFTIFKLADRYLTPMLFNKCNHFIEEEPWRIDEFGQRVFDLLQLAIDMDLDNIKTVLRKNTFTSYGKAYCKKCDSPAKCGRSKTLRNGGKTIAGLYLPNKHICMEHKDYIMNLNPSMISFILQSLIDSARVRCSFYNPERDETEVDESDGSDEDVPNKDRALETYEEEEIEKLLVYNFTTKGPYHDSTIIVQDQIFHVNSGIVLFGAKWFRGRLEKGSHVVVLDVSSVDFEHFLNYIYPNAHPISCYSPHYLNLFEMAVRFESPHLYQKTFEEMEMYICEMDSYFEPSSVTRVIEIAVKYNLREVKKLFYSNYIKPFNTIRCSHSSCDLHTMVDCEAKDGMKKHRCKPDGVFNSLRSTIFREKRTIRKLSPEAQRFLLASILNNVNAVL